MKRFGVFFVGYCGVEVGTAAEPAPGRRQEARVHVHGGHVRVGHVGDEADAGGEESGVFLGAGDGFGELGAELATDGRDIDSDFLEYLARQLAAHSAATRLAARVGAVPRRVGEGGIRAGVALDLFKCRADAASQRFEPVARRLLLVVEGKHGASHRGCAPRTQGCS